MYLTIEKAGKKWTIPRRRQDWTVAFELNNSDFKTRHCFCNDQKLHMFTFFENLGTQLIPVNSNILSSTSLYLNTDAKQRQKVVSEAFAGV